MSVPTQTLIGQILAPTSAGNGFQGPRPMAADAPVSTLIGRILSGPVAPAPTVTEPILAPPAA
jgi:hypothetical protein